MHCYNDLIRIFDHCFGKQYNTRLVRGDDEPIYLPANASQTWNAVCFAHGFFSSALHESAHWLIAGKQRREQIDYGYWYVPDGRSAEEQALFQQVEVKPQALEWILSSACGYRFQFSIDNLDGEEHDSQRFRQAVYEQVFIYCQNGLPQRARRFHQALSRFYGTGQELDISLFDEPFCARQSVPAV